VPTENHQEGFSFSGAIVIIVLDQVATAQADVKAAQQVLADVRKVFSDRAQAQKAARGAAGKAKAKASTTRRAKAKASP